MNKIFLAISLILLTTAAYATDRVVVIPLEKTVKIEAPLSGKVNGLKVLSTLRVMVYSTLAPHTLV
jgi:hypothetical protein